MAGPNGNPKDDLDPEGAWMSAILTENLKSGKAKRFPVACKLHECWFQGRLDHEALDTNQ